MYGDSFCNVLCIYFVIELFNHSIVLNVFQPRCKLANSGQTNMLGQTLNKCIIKSEKNGTIQSIKAFINSLQLLQTNQTLVRIILKQRTQKWRWMSRGHGQTIARRLWADSRPRRPVNPECGIIWRRLRMTPTSANSAGNIEAASLETSNLSYHLKH